ncbi:MAG: ribonuclease R, partial [Proteobacteria bacterium]|nr:ribonuclease R [Pseudomonadota bacterium]
MPELDEKKQKVLAFLKDESARPMSFRDITRAFGVTRDERDEVKAVLRSLMADGSVVKIRGGRYAVGDRLNLITGTLSCHPDGFGFVVPEDASEKETGDIFINPRRMAGAMHGDTVGARVERVKEANKREGKIVRVITRARTNVVGRYERGKGYAIVVPSDERIIESIIIPRGESKGAKNGEIVEAEITRYGEKNHAPTGRIVEVIGDPNDPDVESTVILKKFGLTAEFPVAVASEAERVGVEVKEADTVGRVDLRKKILFTIDGETARDFDDAVGIEAIEGGGHRLFVSIADVSFYVPEGGVIDTEAYARSTSVYFPDRCIPMLPEALSNGICSLNPGVDRLAMTAELEFDASGEMKSKRFYESVIKSAERLTYTKVKAILIDKEPGLLKEYKKILPDLAAMEGLAAKLTKKRAASGSLDFDLPEPQIIIDMEGRVEDIVRSERNVAHRLIEEFMLAANRAVALAFSSRELPSLYRVHDEPDTAKVEVFNEFIHGFGLSLQLGGKRSSGPKAFQAVLRSVDNTPEEKLINHVLLRSMKQAVYSTDNTGHFGLAFTDYTHFTSPIRRYPDLVIHRLLKALVRKEYDGKLKERMAAALPDVAVHTSTIERKAMEAEREISDLKKAQFMRDKVGLDYKGIVSGVTSFGLFVELDEYFVECLVHVSSLDDYYVFDAARHTLTGEHSKESFQLCDPVTVTIDSVDLERRRVAAVLVVPEGDRPKRNRAGKRPAALKTDDKKNKPGKKSSDKKNDKRDKSKKKRGEEAGKPDKKKSASGSKK